MNKAKLSVYNEMEVSFKQMANCFTVSPASSSWCPLHPDFSYIFWSLHLFIFLIYSSAKIYIIAWMFGNISPAFHCNTSSNLLTVFFCKIRYGIWSKKLLPWQTQIPLLPNKGFPFFFMVIMNQEALREGNNIERLMMMNRFGKTPADLKLPSPLPLQALPVLLMQNKMKKLLQKEAENSPRKIWNNETETEDVRTHSWVGGKYPGGFQGWEWSPDSQKEHFKQLRHRPRLEELSMPQSAFASFTRPIAENSSKGDDARWRHENPAQLPGVSELLLTKGKMRV